MDFLINPSSHYDGDCLFKNGGETPIGASLQITTSHDGLEIFSLSFVGAERLECVEFKNAASLRKRMNLKRRCSVVVETDDLPLCYESQPVG